MKHPPLLKFAMAAIEDVKALDVRVLDVRALTPMTDFMAICTGTSRRHVQSIAENVVARIKERGWRPRSLSGMEAGEWVLVDLGDVLVHVMQAPARVFYQLEKLWDVPIQSVAKSTRPKTKPKPKPKPRVRTKPRAKRGSKPRAPSKRRGRR